MSLQSVVVPAVDRSLSILEYIAASVSPVSVKELSRELAIPQATAFRLVGNLVAREYLAESYQVPGKYELGFRVLFLAAKAGEKIDVRATALPFMLELAQGCPYTVQLGAFHGENMFLLEQVPRPTAPGATAPSQPLPVNAGATSKVLCAWLPLQQRTNYVQQREFVAMTKNSIMEKDAYLAVLDAVKKQGFALDLEEYSYGMACAAMPVFDFGNQCVAAMGFSGFAADFRNEEKLEKLLAALADACQKTSYRLGYRQQAVSEESAKT